MAMVVNKPVKSSEPKLKKEKLTEEQIKKNRLKGRSHNTRKQRTDGATDVKIPQNGPGNSKGDQAWLEAQIAAGLIEPIDPDDDSEEIPFGAMQRWTGKPEDFGSSWQLPEEEGRCKARSKVRDGEGRYVIGQDNKALLRPCRRWAIRGGNVCVTHGGGLARVRAAASMRLAGAADGLIGALIKIAMDNTVDPKARVQAINSALDRAGVKATIDFTVESPSWEKMLGKMFGEWNDDAEDDDDDEAAK